MLRAISNHQVEGFPTADQVRSIFTEDDIRANQMKMSLVAFVKDTIGFWLTPSDGEDQDRADRRGLRRGDVRQPHLAALGRLEDEAGPRTHHHAAGRHYADMDEPTNHLDVANVQGVVDDLNSLREVTCLIISHDTSFLDTTIQRVVGFKVGFKELKLNPCKGNITDFVERFPAPKSYFELTPTSIVLKLPTLGVLGRGTRNKGRTLLEIKGVPFMYPGATKPQISEVTVRLSKASRVAIVGFKSAMIKVLTGKDTPGKGKGEVVMHPNCRFAYVGQHAFHHIEQHLEKTPRQYMLWRDRRGQGRAQEFDGHGLGRRAEGHQHAARDDHQGRGRQHQEGEARARAPRLAHARRTRRATCTRWYPAQMLEKWGCIKLPQGAQPAPRRGGGRAHSPRATSRSTTTASGSSRSNWNHNRMCDLSGGQKVKVVVLALHRGLPARSSWTTDQRPGPRVAGRGVCLITQNEDFADANATETWAVAKRPEGDERSVAFWSDAAEQEVLFFGCDSVIIENDCPAPSARLPACPPVCLPACLHATLSAPHLSRAAPRHLTLPRLSGLLGAPRLHVGRAQAGAPDEGRRHHGAVRERITDIGPVVLSQRTVRAYCSPRQ
jgi:elongation factor 3